MFICYSLSLLLCNVVLAKCWVKQTRLPVTESILIITIVLFICSTFNYFDGSFIASLQAVILD